MKNDREVRQLEAEARDAGRGEAASWWPLVDQEGYERGRQDERHALALRLRRRARQDPVARELLLEVLDESDPSPGPRGRVAPERRDGQVEATGPVPEETTRPGSLERDASSRTSPTRRPDRSDASRRAAATADGFPSRWDPDDGDPSPVATARRDTFAGRAVRALAAAVKPSSIEPRPHVHIASRKPS